MPATISPTRSSSPLYHKHGISIPRSGSARKRRSKRPRDEAIDVHTLHRAFDLLERRLGAVEKGVVGPLGRPDAQSREQQTVSCSSTQGRHTIRRPYSNENPETISEASSPATSAGANAAERQGHGAHDSAVGSMPLVHEGVHSTDGGTSYPVVDSYGVQIQALRSIAKRDEAGAYRSKNQRSGGSDGGPLVYTDGEDPEEVEIEAHLARHRRRMQVLRAAVMLQSTWRMFVAFRAYRRHAGRGRHLVAAHYYAWRTSYVADRMCRHSLLRRSIKELHEYADWQVRIRRVANRVFQKSASSGKLTVQVVNLFFLHHTGKGRAQRLAIDDIWVSGVLRNILTVIVRGWGLEVRRLKTNRLQAAVHLVKAQRLSATGQNTWMSEKVFVLFHLWRRMVAFKKALYSGQRPFPTFGEPLLSEWETWVFDDTKRRVIKSKLSVLGGELLERWVMDRWKAYMAYQRMESFRELEAEEHYCGSLIRKCMMAWDALARERGRVLRSRIKYLTAWKRWTPLHKRLSKCKAAVRERARVLRLRALLRTWQKQILTLHQLEAFRVDSLTDRCCHQTYLAIGYTWTEMPTHFTALRCWREWRDVTKRSIRWRRFSFFQRKMFAENLMRLVLRAWHMVSGEKHKDIDKLTIEPVGSVDRLLAIESKVGRGFLPETILTKTELTRLLCPNIDVKDTSTVKAPEQGPEVDRLITAVGERDEATVSNLLSSGVAVNGVASDGTGRTALLVACSQISPEILPIIAQLLGAGALLTVRDAEERLPLDVTVNPQIASMLHLHKQRLWAGEFTKEEKRRSVDILNESWGTMGSRSLWRYVTLGLVRHRMTTTQKQVKYLQLPYELTLREWKDYRKFNARHPRYGDEPDDFEYLRSGSSLDTGIRSRSPKHSRHGTRDDLMRQQSSMSQLHPLQSQPSHVSETYSQQPISSRSGTTDGDISSVAGHHTAASFHQGGHDHGFFEETYMNAELREQLWGLFPLFEQNQRFVRLLSLLDRAQPSADRFTILDKELLTAWGIDLNRDEVDGTRFKPSFKPDTCLIEAPGLNPSHTRRLDLKRTADVREVCPTVEERSIVRRSEVWFEAWCNRNADLLAAIPSSPKAQQQPQSTRKEAAPANVAQDDTVKLKALMVCRHAMERKSNRVLEGRRGVLKRDRFLLEGVLGRISDAHEARPEGEGLVGLAAVVEEPSQPPQEVKSPGRPSPMTSSRRTRAQYYPLTIDVVPYLHQDTYDLSVSMRPPIRAPSHTKAIAFVVSNVTSTFWSQAIRPYDDFDADYSSVVAYLPAHWAKEDRIMDILRSHYRVLKQDEVTLSRDYKALTAELAKLTKTLKDAYAVEDMAAIHVVQQAAYMKEKVRKVKGKLYSAIKGLNRRHEELDTVRVDLAQAETELQRVTSAFSLLCGDTLTALSAKDASELRVPKDTTPRSKTKWRKLSQAFTEKSDKVKELRDYLVMVQDEIEAGKQRVASATIENVTTSTQLKQLLKESLMFIHQAGTMRSMYRDERRSMVTRAKQLLHSLNCTRAKLYDVLTLFQEIKALVAARSAIQRMAGPTDELALDRDSEVSFVDAELEAACLEQLEKEEEEEAAEHKRSKKGQKKAARRAKGRKAKAKRKARTSEQSLSEAATVEETESEVEDDSLVKESQDGVRDDDEAVEHGQTDETHGRPKQMLRPPAIVTVAPMGTDNSAQGPAKPSVLEEQPADGVASLQALEASYRKRGDAEKRKMEEALRLLGLTFNGDVRELAKPQPQSSLALVVEEARSRIVAERIEKTSAPSSSNTSISSGRVMSFGRTVRSPHYDAETLYEDALQKLFFDERQQYYEAKDREMQDAAEREAEEQTKQATGGFSDEDIEVLLTEEDEERPVTPTEDEADAVGPVVSSKKPSAFMRIWDRVRRQKMLLFKVNPVQEDNERAEKTITNDARCTLYEFANMGVALQSPRIEGSGPQDGGYGGVALLSDDPTAAKPEDDDGSSGLWADGAPIMASISMKKPIPVPARPARSTATSAKGVTSPKGRAARAETPSAQATRSSLTRYFFSNFELTNALLAQKRLVRNMDEKELAPLKGDEDFMRVCSTYALSFGVDNDSVFQSSAPSPRMPVPTISSPTARDRSMRGSPASPSFTQSGTGSPVRAVFVSATSPTRSSYSSQESSTSSVASSRAAKALLKNMTLHSPASAARPMPTDTGIPPRSPPPNRDGSLIDKEKKSPGSPAAEQRPRSRSPSPKRQRQQAASPPRERQHDEEQQLPAQDLQSHHEEMGQKQHDDALQNPKKTEHKSASPKKEPSQRTSSSTKPQVKSPNSSPPRPSARTKQKKKQQQPQAQQKASHKRSEDAGKRAHSDTRPPSLSTVPETQPRRPSFEWSEGPSSPIIHAIIEGDEDEDGDGEQEEKVHVYSPGDEEPASPPETASPFPRPRSPPYAWTSPQVNVQVLGEAQLSPPQRAPDDIWMSIDLAISSKPDLVTTAASAPATQSEASSCAHAASKGAASQASEALPSDVQDDDDSTSMASTEAGEEEKAAPYQRETVYHPVVGGAQEMGQRAASRDRGPRPSALLCVGKAPAGLPASASSAHKAQGAGKKQKKDRPVDRRRTRNPDLSAFVAFGFTDQPLSGSNPYPHAKRHVGRSALRDKHSGMHPEGAPALELVGAEAPATGTPLKAVSSTLTSESMVGPDNIGLARSSQSSSHIVFTQTSGVSIERARDGLGYSYQYYDRSNVPSHARETDIGDPPPAVEWSLKEQKDTLSEYVALETSEQRLKRLQGTRPQLVLEGLGYVDPTAEEAEAAPMWTVDMPPLSPSRKEKIWDDFQGAPLPKRARSAYQELGAVQNKVDMEGMLDELQMVQDDSHAFLEDLRSCLPLHSPLQHLFDRITEPDDIASIPLDDFAVGTLAPSAFASGPATPPLSSSEDTLGVLMTDECVQEVLNMAASADNKSLLPARETEDRFDVGLLKRGREPAAEIVMTLALREMLQEMTQGQEDSPGVTQGRSRSSKLSVPSRVTRLSRRQVVEQNRRIMRERAEQQTALQLGHSWSYGYATEAKPHGEHRPKPLLRARPPPAMEAAAATVAPTPSRSSSEAKEDTGPSESTSRACVRSKGSERAAQGAARPSRERAKRSVASGDTSLGSESRGAEPVDDLISCWQAQEEKPLHIDVMDDVTPPEDEIFNGLVRSDEHRSHVDAEGQRASLARMVPGQPSTIEEGGSIAAAVGGGVDNQSISSQSTLGLEGAVQNALQAVSLSQLSVPPPGYSAESLEGPSIEEMSTVTLTQFPSVLITDPAPLLPVVGLQVRQRESEKSAEGPLDGGGVYGKPLELEKPQKQESGSAEAPVASAIEVAHAASPAMPMFLNAFGDRRESVSSQPFTGRSSSASEDIDVDTESAIAAVDDARRRSNAEAAPTPGQIGHPGSPRRQRAHEPILKVFKVVVKDPKAKRRRPRKAAVSSNAFSDGSAQEKPWTSTEMRKMDQHDLQRKEALLYREGKQEDDVQGDGDEDNDDSIWRADAKGLSGAGFGTVDLNILPLIVPAEAYPRVQAKFERARRETNMVHNKCLQLPELTKKD